ncbi:MAG: efflux RND transporter periplasmic adaptor subunit [Betaproteobacteria bacterium]|nr:efflux RND transporter periplasmic adaptor subunit [Betaproteobacteria bacterium]
MTLRTLLVLTVAASAILTGCGTDSDGQTPANAPKKSAEGKTSPSAPQAASKPHGLPVRAVQVTTGSISTRIMAVGSLVAEESVVIRPEIAGRVVDLPFKEGQAVRKGTRLVLIDPSELKANLASSSAKARTEAQKFQRTKELREQNFISQDALDTARGAMESAQAQQRRDEVMLEKASIVAPFSGILGLRYISPGAYVKEGDDIITLDDIAELKLDFRVPEIYVSRLRVGQKVSVVVDAYGEQPFSGKISALDPSVDPKTRTIQARAKVPNGDMKLRPGMFARVYVDLDTRNNALLLPEQAIWPQGKDTFVYKVVDGKAVLTKVVLGERRPGEVEILDGLTANDVVVTDGQIKLKPGAPVTVLPGTPAPAGPGGAKTSAARSAHEANT